MSDTFTPAERSRIMAAVKSEHTGPERKAHGVIDSLKIRNKYKTNDKTLPGKPDIVFHRLKKIIFVHGCFWHGHKNCKRSARPSSNTKFWNEKIEKNMLRDQRHKRKLWKEGWSILTIWECQMKDAQKLANRINNFIRKKPGQ